MRTYQIRVRHTINPSLSGTYTFEVQDALVDGGGFRVSVRYQRPDGLGSALGPPSLPYQVQTDEEAIDQFLAEHGAERVAIDVPKTGERLPNGATVLEAKQRDDGLVIVLARRGVKRATYITWLWIDGATECGNYYHLGLCAAAKNFEERLTS